MSILLPRKWCLLFDHLLFLVNFSEINLKKKERKKKKKKKNYKSEHMASQDKNLQKPSKKEKKASET